MAATPNADVIQRFARSVKMIQDQCGDMSQAQSLKLLPFNHNCLNWTVGHLLRVRKRMLDILDADAFDWPESANQAYGDYPSCQEAAAGAAKGKDFAQLLQDLDASQALLVKALERKDLSAYEGEHPFIGGRKATPKQIIEFLQWHEAIHTGEIQALSEALKA